MRSVGGRRRRVSEGRGRYTILTGMTTGLFPPQLPVLRGPRLLSCPSGRLFPWPISRIPTSPCLNPESISVSPTRGPHPRPVHTKGVVDQVYGSLSSGSHPVFECLTLLRSRGSPLQDKVVVTYQGSRYSSTIVSMKPSWLLGSVVKKASDGLFSPILKIVFPDSFYKRYVYFFRL